MSHGFSNAWNGATRIVDNFLTLLPNLVLGVIAFVIFLILASVAKSATRRFVGQRKTHKNLSVLLGQIAYAVALILGSLIAISIVAPSFHAGDLIKILGIGSVAVGLRSRIFYRIFLPAFCCCYKSRLSSGIGSASQE